MGIVGGASIADFVHFNGAGQARRAVCHRLPACTAVSVSEGSSLCLLARMNAKAGAFAYGRRILQGRAKIQRNGGVCRIMPNNVTSKSPARAFCWVSISAKKGQHLLRRSGIGGQLLSLIIVMGIFAIGTRGKYLSWPNLQVILSLTAIPAIIAIGLHQVVVFGGIDLSVGGV